MLKSKNKFRETTLIFLLSAFLMTASIYSQTVRKAPYLIYAGINTEMQVLWQVDASSADTVRWGTDQIYSSGMVVSYPYGGDNQHKYTITSLTPGAKYYYQVKIGNASYGGSFHAAPGELQTSVKFFAYGDNRTNPGIHNQIADSIISAFIKDTGYQTFILSAGDLVTDGNQESYWANEFFNSQYAHIREMIASLPFQACMGNHEGTGALFQKYFPYPDVSGRYWSFDYGPAHFLVVDQYFAYAPGSAQYQWINNDLASSAKPWKFICLHEPGWSAAGGHSNNSSVQQYIEPLCEKYNVQIVFAGHNHYYARASVKGGIGKSVQHVTTGGGGAPLYTPASNQPFVVASAGVYHYCRVNIESDTFLQFEAVSVSGAVIDQFTIRRAPAAVAISAGFNPSVYGQAVPLTAVVSGGDSTATGTVMFKSGASLLGTGTLNVSGSATYTTGILSVGVNPITAVYYGDANHVGSTSGVLSDTVIKASTATSLSASANPSAYGLPLTLTATVNALAPGAGIPSGPATFKDSSAIIGTGSLNGSGHATLATSSLATGVHMIKAEYGGDGNFTGSESSVLSDTVVDFFTIHATANAHGNISPSGAVIVNVGGAVTFTITPDPGYHVDSVIVDNVKVDSTASYTFSNVISNHAVTAKFAVNRHVVRVRLLKDLDGKFNTSADRAPLKGHLEIRLGAPSGPVLGSADSTVLQVALEGDTTVYSRWAAGYGLGDRDNFLLGRIKNGIAAEDTSSSVIFVLTGGENATVDYVAVSKSYNQLFRSFMAESLALDKDNKGKLGKYVQREPDKNSFSFHLYAPGTASISLKFSAPTDGEAIYTHSGAADTSFFVSSVVFRLPNPCDSASVFKISGYGNKARMMKIKYVWQVQNSSRIIKGTVADTSFDYQILRLPMPNRVNALYETLIRDAYGAGGMAVGRNRKTPSDSSRYYGWFQTTKYGDVLKTLIVARTLRMHSNSPHGFDYYTGGTRPLLRQQKTLPPGRYNNRLLADMIALKLSVAASRVKIVPPGFAELVYDDGTPGNSMNGKMIAEIASIADSVMMGYLEDFTDTRTGRPGKRHKFAGLETYQGFDTVIQKINAAFEGEIDTSRFSGTLELEGVKPLIEIPYLRANPNAIPGENVPARDVISQEEQADFASCRNYPNPFNPTTTIQFGLPGLAYVTLKVYNTLGQEVTTLLDHQLMEGGTQEVQFDAEKLATGIYFYQIMAKSVDDEGDMTGYPMSIVKKMVFLK